MRLPFPPALVACLAVVLPVGAAGVKTPAADKARANPALETLIARLGDNSYRVRQAAQKALARMGTDVLPALLKARKTRTDLEIVRRLELLIPALERAAMLQPRLVTLRLSKRPLADVVAEITRQTGYVIDLDNNNPNNQLYSFNFEKVPFWQALDRVCKEANVALYPYYYGNGVERLRLYSYGSSPGPFVGYTETFRLVATGFNYGRSVTFGGVQQKEQPFPRSEYLNLNLSVHAEPKLPFLAVYNPVITHGYDDKKRSLVPRATGVVHYYDQSQHSPYGNGTRTYHASLSLNLVRPSRDSKVARLVRGEIPVLVLSKAIPVIVVANPLAVKKQKFKGGKTEIEIEQVTANNGWANGKAYQFRMTVKEETSQTQHDYAWTNSLQHRLVLEDARGQRYVPWGSSFSNRAPRQVQGDMTFRPPDPAPNQPAVGPPVKLTFNEWVTARHQIKFEFKDLPLP